MRHAFQLATLCGLSALAGWPGPGYGGEPNPVQAARLALQESGLRGSLAATAAVVVRGEGGLELHFPARLAFVADRTELLPAGTEMLDVVARSLRDFRRTQVVVAVFSDAIGSSDYNQQAAQARAGAVVAYLQTRGIAPDRLIARGVGEARPLPAPDTPEGRDLNRRLELTITPLST